MMRPATCVMLVGAAAGQLVPPGTTLSHASRCDFSLAEMWNRTLALDAECPGAPAQCSIACGVALTMFMDSCGSFVDVLFPFDSADGVQDGRAGAFYELAQTCNAIPPEQLLGVLRPLWSAGQCPDDWMEGVGATAVVITCVTM